jgi:hypothetical protein
MNSSVQRLFFVVLAASMVVACGDSSSNPPQTPQPSDTPEYVSQAPASSTAGDPNSQAGGASGERGGSSPPSAPADNGSKSDSSVPGGRVADVQEADVYKIAGGKLFLFNTYRGFLTYDISDSKKPVRLGRLPVYGYPVEMFVENNTVYALLSDSLYLTEVEGKLQFQRRNTSQIVSIDISDVSNPKLLQAQDLAGQLREGVSRKIENTIYVVSYQPAGYWYYGWGARNGQQPNEQAWVYSFDVSSPSSLKQVGALKIFEGGSTSSYDPNTGESHSRYSSGVTLSATANAIMAVQNWHTDDSVPGSKETGVDGGSKETGVDGGSKETGVDGGSSGTRTDCWSYKSDQQSIVSVVDVSNPTGVIKVAATFTTAGALTDQFKQTYVYDAEAKTGTYLGIFARSQWTSGQCNNFTRQTQNTLEAWNLNGDGTATQLSAVDFGKPNETVRGSYFDVDRKVAFAITALSMDPMYAISFADRTKLTILSAIDGLSGDMDLFRPVEGGQYLLAVGRDTGAACASYVPPPDGSADAGAKPGSWNNQISVSLIDVRDLSKIRLVQRKCLDIANAGWVSSQVTWNLDQAHKMIGLSSDGTTNVLTVPVSYSVPDQSDPNGWYYYRYETAVGIMSWDLSQYRDTLPAEQQSVIATHGHFVHPNGEVNRSVVYRQGATREMLNISDSHLSFANIQDLDAPALDSVVEVASAEQAVFRFGDYVVQQVALPSNDFRQAAFEFRVKSAGADLEGAPTLASFRVGQLQQVIRHGDKLVMLRVSEDMNGNGSKSYGTVALVYDLTSPLAPKALGSVKMPDDVNPYRSYYRYYCGGMGYYGGYYFGDTQSMASVDEGIAFLIQTVNYQSETVVSNGKTVTQDIPTYKRNLAFLDLRDPSQPQSSEIALDLPGPGGNTAESASLVADSMASDGFYISYRVPIGSTQDPTTNATLVSYAYYAQRWLRRGGAWSSESAINIPGSLVRSWAGSAGARRFLTRDDVYSTRAIDGGGWQWIDTVTLNLLEQAESGGAARAVRLDSRSFTDRRLKSLAFDGDRIYMVSSDTPYYWGYIPGGPGRASGSSGSASAGAAADAGGKTDTATDTSDRLVIIDTSQNTLASSYERPTELTNLELMGAQQGRLFVNLQGDGILVVDVADAAAPKALSFYRTLGWASGIEFAGTSAYVPASYYGTYRLDLSAPGNL